MTNAELVRLLLRVGRYLRQPDDPEVKVTLLVDLEAAIKAIEQRKSA